MSNARIDNLKLFDLAINFLLNKDEFRSDLPRYFYAEHKNIEDASIALRSQVVELSFLVFGLSDPSQRHKIFLEALLKACIGVIKEPFLLRSKNPEWCLFHKLYNLELDPSYRAFRQFLLNIKDQKLEHFEKSVLDVLEFFYSKTDPFNLKFILELRDKSLTVARLAGIIAEARTKDFLSLDKSQA